MIPPTGAWDLALEMLARTEVCIDVLAPAGHMQVSCLEESHLQGRCWLSVLVEHFFLLELL